MYGVLPDGMPRGVLYYPNAGMEPTSDLCLDDMAELYSGRGFGMLRSVDATVMEQRHVIHQRALVRHLNSVGISRFPPERIIGIPDMPGDHPRCSHAFVRELLRRKSPLAEQIQATGAKILLPYIGEANTDLVAQKLGLETGANRKTTDLINNKWYVKQALQNIGIPVPPGRKLTTSDTAHAAFRDLMDLARNDKTASGILFAKMNRSAAGRGITQLECRKDLDRWIIESKLCDPMQKFDSVISEGAFLDIGIALRDANQYPSSIIYVSPQKGCHLYINDSYQIIENGTDHVGNKGPLSLCDRKIIMPYMDKIAAWMHCMGAFGLAGVDFVMGANGVPYLLEINFRMNASTTAAMIASLKNSPAWMYGKIQVKSGTGIHESIRHISTSGILFNGTSGAIIINALPALHGHNFMQGVFLATNDFQLQAIYEKAQMTG